MKRSVGLCVLGLSAGGHPHTRVVMRRWGKPGAHVVQSVSMGLALRDASMVAGDVPRRLRPFPAALLRLELATALAASVAGLFPLLGRAEKDRVSSAGSHRVEVARRLAVIALFGLHTIRCWIYLQPDQGRRRAT